MREETWAKVARERRQSIASKIPGEWVLQASQTTIHPLASDATFGAILTKQEADITRLSAIDLVDAIRTRRYTSVSVTLAFCKRAAIAHQLV
jgi:amidase